MNISISSYFFIALGGALGSILRVYMSTLIAGWKTWDSVSYPSYMNYLLAMPLGILSVNIIGCFLMGVLSEFIGVYQSATYNFRLFIFSGFLGGFTTFSAFSLEFGLLFQKNLYGTAVLYGIFSIVFSLIAFFLGVKIIKLIM